MNLTPASSRHAPRLLHLLVLLGLWLACAGPLFGAHAPRATALSALPALQEERELLPSERVRLLFGELVFGAAVLAVSLSGLRGLFGLPVSPRKAGGFPWERLARAVTLALGLVGLATVFALARYPFLLYRGFLGSPPLPAGQGHLLRLPLALSVCLALLLLVRLAHWRQKRPRLRHALGDALLLAAGVMLIGLLYA